MKKTKKEKKFYQFDAASESSLNKKAGLKFANKLKDLRNAKRACSGRLSHSRLSHCGPPTAPNKIASESFAIFNVSSVKGVPNSS